MKKRETKMQKGGMLLEALAVLGLLTVATPVVYKKAIEKSKEIEDITVASQMRTIRDAAATYVEKNYETLEDGDRLVLSDLTRYLPPNFTNNISKNLVAPGSDIDTAMSIVVKKDESTVGNNGLPVKRASAYVITNSITGSGRVDEKRGNRIASLIGSEGGYVLDNNTLMGSNNAWQRDLASIQDKNNTLTIAEGQIVAGTTFSKDPLAGDFLYRNSVEGFPQFNMMMTNLDMNGNSIEKVRSLGLKYYRDDDFDSIEFNGESGQMTGRNTAKKTTVTMATNDVNNSGALSVTAENQNGCSRLEGNYDGTNAGGLSGCNRAGDETVAMTAAYIDPSNHIQQHGMLSVRSNSTADGEALAYGGYVEGSAAGGAYEVRDSSGDTRGLLIGEQNEADTRTRAGVTGMGTEFTEAGAAKLQMYDEDEHLRAYVGGTNIGGRILLGDSGGLGDDLGNAANRTLFADAKTASITSKKDGLGYAQMTSRYNNTAGAGYGNVTDPSGALIVANAHNLTDFALVPTAVTAVLSSHNNSGYLRLNNGTYAGERVKISAIQKDGTTVGGATYLFSNNNVNDTVTMEANRANANAGYMEFKSNIGGSSIVDANLAGASNTVGYLARNAGSTEKVRLLSDGGSGGGHLNLDSGKVIFAANDRTDFTGGAVGPVLNLRVGNDSTSNKVAVAAIGNNSQPIASAKSDTGYANFYANNSQESNGTTSNSSAAMLLSPNGTNNTVAAYAAATGKYGTTGTVSISNFGRGGLEAHGKLTTKNTVYGTNASDGGVVVAKNENDIGTAWLVGNSSYNGGMLSVGPDATSKKNRVDLYASGGNVLDMGGTGHLFNSSENQTISIYSNFDGLYSTGMSNVENRGNYKEYAVVETNSINATEQLNSTDIYAKGDITVGGKLYTNVLCLSLGNKLKDGDLRDSFSEGSGGKVASAINANLDASGENNCIPLSPKAKWRDIVYEAVMTDAKLAKSFGELRGHTHGGFAVYGHTHPSYIPVSDEKHHASGEGKAQWNRVSTHYVGDLCLTRAWDSSHSNSHASGSITCTDKCGGWCNEHCISEYDSCDHTEEVCTGEGEDEECTDECVGGWACRGNWVNDGCGCNSSSTVNGVPCCNSTSVHDERESYWTSVGKK